MPFIQTPHYSKYFDVITSKHIFISFSQNNESEYTIWLQHLFCRGQLNYYLVFVMMTSRNSFKSVCNSLTFEKKDNIYSWYVIALFFPNKTRDGVAGSNISVYSFFSLVLDRSRTHTWCVFEIKELMNIDFSRKI